MPTVPETKAAWTNGVDALSSTNLNAYLRDPIRFLMGKPVARLRQTVIQGLVNNADTPLTFTSEDVDTDPDGIGGHSTSTNTSRYTARYTGWYRVGGAVAITGNATGFRGSSWLVNGAILAGSKIYLPNNGSGAAAIPARPMLVRLVEGDFVELAGYQNSGAILNSFVSIGEFVSSMDVTWERL
ncbi:hypothetical protein C5N14_13600 [Micromonospora sp. MW-13]|uniref:hypothetical protein n=1 Tax=Micromonospora sp. MW-13 TaxID=2094022 RepID=UPI000E439A6F|nr:hypothetical protein [Micromonospora sp. MW-13]RGC68416.1 hypothetical protein C5N14_13600 [Micromonospora sp. MW-13]